MAHKKAVVEWWNSIGYLFGRRSDYGRDFMLNPNNYKLEPRSKNRSEGAKMRIRYKRALRREPVRDGKKGKRK